MAGYESMSDTAFDEEPGVWVPIGNGEVCITDLEPLDTALEPTRQGPIEDITQLHETFTDIQPTLNAAGLAHVEPFHMVYGAVTRNVHAATDPETAGTFAEGRRYAWPQDVLEMTGRFADRYFRPMDDLVAYLKGDQAAWDRIPAHWQEMFTPPTRHTEPGELFVYGMTGHISGGHDLADALAESTVGPRYKDGFTYRTGNILRDTTDQFAEDLIPGHPWLRALAKEPVLAYIAQRRQEAWDNADRLRQAGNEEERETIRLELDAIAAQRIRNLKSYGGLAMDTAKLTEKLPFGMGYAENGPAMPTERLKRLGAVILHATGIDNLVKVPRFGIRDRHVVLQETDNEAL